jgi:hypothetical protein
LQTGIMGHAMGLADIVQMGHFWSGQQLTGSVPAATGCGQAIGDIGQARGGFVGSHDGGAGTHALVQVCPVQLPAGSQEHVASFGGHEHVLTVPAAVAPAGVAHPQPTHVVLHR